MEIPAVLTLVEALAELTAKSEQSWTRSTFFSQVVGLALPLRATTPKAACPVIAAGEEFVSAQLPYPGRRLAVLSTPQIKDLWLYGATRTRSVALEPGEPGYLDWAEIKARRKVLNRSAHSPESWNAKWPDGDWHDGEFMGECGFSLFNDVVNVTDSTCRVPRETIEELLVVLAAEGNARATSSADTQEKLTDASATTVELSTTYDSQGTHEHVPFAINTVVGADVTVPEVSRQDMCGANNPLAGLFDPVTHFVLERMLPAGGKWAGWAERAARNGLKDARQGRGLFNPYLAALWFLQQGEPNWDLARCYRTLAKNLPPRSLGENYKLTGLLD